MLDPVQEARPAARVQDPAREVQVPDRDLDPDQVQDRVRDPVPAWQPRYQDSGQAPGPQGRRVRPGSSTPTRYREAAPIRQPSIRTVRSCSKPPVPPITPIQ